MEEVFLPKRVHEAIQELKKQEVTAFAMVDFSYLREHHPDQATVINRYCNPYFENNLNAYLKAILYGYSIEKEPEERILEYYFSESNSEGIINETVKVYTMSGIKKTVEILSKKYPELEDLLKKMDHFN